MLKNKTYNALVIGCGNMGALNDCKGSGNEHKTISYIKGLLEHGGFDIYCYDAVYEHEEYASRIWNVKTHSVGMKYDVVIIATPDNTHYNELKNITSNSPSLAICEKPLCSDFIEAKEIVEEYERLGIPLLVDYTRVFIPYWRDLKERYEKGEFGKLLDYYVSYNRGDLHTGTHATNFMDWFFKGEINNSLHFNHADHIPYRVWQIELFFEKKYISETRIGNMPVSDIYDNHTLHVIENAYNFLLGKEDLFCTGRDALRALELINNKQRG